MSTLATHALIGLLLGIALRLPKRYLPVAAVLPLLADLDHLGLFYPIGGLVSRGTLHNVFALIAAPLAAFVVLDRFWPGSGWTELAAKSPPILVSAAFADMVSLDEPDLGGVLLFHPVHDVWYSWRAIVAESLDPTAVSTGTLMLAVLAVLVLATLAFWRYRPGSLGERGPPQFLPVGPGGGRPGEDQGAHRRRSARRDAAPGPAGPADPAGPAPLAHRAGWVGAFAAAWLLLLPGLAAAGLVVPTVPGLYHDGQRIDVVDATATIPEGRIVAEVRYPLAYPAPAGTLELQVVELGEADPLIVVTNPRLEPGEPWHVELRYDGDACDLRESGVLLMPANRLKEGFWQVGRRVDATVEPGACG